MKTTRGFDVQVNKKHCYVRLRVKGHSFKLVLGKSGYIEQIKGEHFDIPNEEYFIATVSYILAARDKALWLKGLEWNRTEAFTRFLEENRNKEGQSPVFWAYVDYWLSTMQEV